MLRVCTNTMMAFFLLGGTAMAGECHPPQQGGSTSFLGESDGQIVWYECGADGTWVNRGPVRNTGMQLPPDHASVWGWWNIRGLAEEPKDGDLFEYRDHGFRKVQR